MKIRIFVGADMHDLENEINKWFAENPKISVVQILQSESESEAEDWAVTISIIHIG